MSTPQNTTQYEFVTIDEVTYKKTTVVSYNEYDSEAIVAQENTELENIEKSKVIAQESYESTIADLEERKSQIEAARDARIAELGE